MAAFKTQGKWDFVKIIIPTVATIILALLAVLYNLQNTAIAEKADKNVVEVTTEQLKSDIEDKVDADTLKEMLKLLEQRNDIQDASLKEQKVIDKETLKTLQELNVQLKLLEQKLD